MILVHMLCRQRTKHIFKISFPVNKKLFRYSAIPRFTASQAEEWCKMGNAWKHTSPVCYVYAATVVEAVLGTCNYSLHGNTTHFLSNTLATG